MGIENSLRDQIYNNMQLKTTEELMQILREDDHEEWSDTSFEVVRQILIQRTGMLPQTPIVPLDSVIKPIEWETVDWKSISDKCNKQFAKSGIFIALFTIILFLCILFGIILLISPPANNSKPAGVFMSLFGVGMLCIMIWSYRRTQTAERMVARARVFLKDTISRGRGTYYNVGFAIKSAFILSKDGMLTASKKWEGHHTFIVLTELYNRIDEQDVVDLVYLSNGQVLGLLEDFKE